MTTPSSTPLALALRQDVRSRRNRRRWVGCLAGSALLLLIAGVVGQRWKLDQLERACRLAKAEKRWSDLQTAAQGWTAWAPRSGAAWAFLADAAQQQERFVEAAEYLSRVPNGVHEELPSLLARCKILMGPANQPYLGEQACLELLKREPRVTEVHELLIQFYAVTLQRDKLRERIVEAIRLRRETPDVYIYHFFIDSLRLAQGPTLCELWLKTHPDDEHLAVAQALHRADAALHDPNSKGDADPIILTEMERDAVELLRQFPNNTNLLAFLIDEEITKGRLPEVLRLLGQSTDNAERDPRFWRYQGWVHFVRGEITEAEAAYRKALAMHPMDWLTLHRLAELLRTRGASDEIVRLENLVARANELRVKIRNLPSAKNPPPETLREIGQLARDTGDTLVAEALDRRVGLKKVAPPPKATLPR